MKKRYRYIYGPVSSWRLGRSLGVDPISGYVNPVRNCDAAGRKRDISNGVKICTFDCLYCQAGKTSYFRHRRKVYVPVRKMIKEIESLPPLKIDYITFSGRGEPTLAKNLGRMIKAVKRIRDEKIAVITNSSLIDRKDVQRDLSLADFVMAKLDASSKGLFAKINKPMRAIKFRAIVKGIKEFRRIYKGRLMLQIMFIRDNSNRKYAKEIAQLVRKINPDGVQINTPLRPSDVKPLSRKEISVIKKYFRGSSTVSVYDKGRKR